MNDTASEYLSNVTGTNAAPKKVFTLAPAPDDDTRRILEARWRVCTHADIEDGAARMFALLQDGSLNPQLNFGRRGVISVSQPVLSSWLHCGERSVRSYMKQLIAIGEIWIRYKTLPHGARIIEYFLTCIRPQDEFEFARKFTDQQLWGRAERKEAFQNSARGGNGRFVKPTRPALPVAPDSQESAESAQIAGSGGNGMPLPAATDFRGPRQPVAADGGNNCRQPRQQVAAVGGNKRPLTAAMGCRGQRQNRPALRETQNGDRDHFENGGGPHPAVDQALEDYKTLWTGPPGHPTHLSKLEKELGRVKVKLMNATGEAREFWQLRADFLRELLDGGKPPKVAAKPTAPATPKPAPISEEKRKAIAAAAAKEAAAFRRRERVAA